MVNSSGPGCAGLWASLLSGRTIDRQPAAVARSRQLRGLQAGEWREAAAAHLLHGCWPPPWLQSCDVTVLALAVSARLDALAMCAGCTELAGTLGPRLIARGGGGLKPNIAASRLKRGSFCRNSPVSARISVAEIATPGVVLRRSGRFWRATPGICILPPADAVGAAFLLELRPV